MTKETDQKFQTILSKFAIPERVIELKPIGNGHINDTYGVKVETEAGASALKYVLQRINHEIFSDVETLQDNVFAVTTEIRKQLRAQGVEDIDRKVLTFIHTNDGDKYFFDGESYWRLCLFINDSESREEVTPDLAYEAGKAFGDFQRMLANLPKGTLGETIPNFHNMEFRLDELHEAIKANKAGRVAEVQDLIAEIEKRADEMTIQERLYREGKLTKRTNHCDTKVNNILFDKHTGKVLSVIDLDTVMPGFVLSDIGDFIRTAANTGAEDEEDLSKIGVNMEIFKAYTKGYMETAKAFLTPQEIKLLPYGGRLLTYMQTVRFLTDYLNGDVYYKTNKPLHNLIRAKAQFAYLLKLEEKKEEMDNFMNEWL